MHDVRRMSDIEQQFKSHPGGSLCMFGEWFGRPMDNIHKPEFALYEGGVLEVQFDEGEILEIGLPSVIERDGRALIINKAEWVKWSWYSYGLPKTKENRFFIMYEKDGGTIKTKTNMRGSYSPNMNEPAVMLC